MRNDPLAHFIVLTPAFSSESCLAEAKKLALQIQGRNRARQHVHVVARLLELLHLSGMKTADFCHKVGLSPSTVRYYARNRHSTGEPWLELEVLRSKTPAVATASPDPALPLEAPWVGLQVVGLGPDDSLLVEQRTAVRFLVEKSDPMFVALLRAHGKL